METIREKLRHLPQDPGIYMMKNAKSAIIYVGKAKNLKNRVSSYFQSSDRLNSKTRKLVRDILDFDVIITKTEVEALLLERTLIRHHLPPYNILLRDDKQYPLLRVDFNEPWPRIAIVRKRENDAATYVGPFSTPGYLRTMVDASYRIFPLIRCTVHEFENARRPCNYYHMRLCLGPCTLPVNREVYCGMIRDALEFIQGKNKQLETSLADKMQKASDEEEYERAAQYRDQLKALNALKEKQSVIIPLEVDADAVALQQSESFAVVHVLIVREGKLMGKDSFILDQVGANTNETIESFLIQYYDGRSLPKEILLAQSIENQAPIQEAINQIGHGYTKFLSPQRGVKRDLVDMAEKNVDYSFQEETRKRQRDFSQLSILQEKLNLPKLPIRMECIDISHIQGTAIVASDVCFMNGKPEKNLYRHYTIKEEIGFGGDDYASIREVVRRRVERGLRDEDFPDLLIIDGGKAQLQSALDVIKEFPNLQLSVVGLAKARTESSGTTSLERVFLPDRETPIPLAPASPECRLLSHIRDEAHRFAITFHRKKRTKVLQSSVLEEISGVGPKMRTKLLEHFGSLDGIKKASFETLRAVPGLKAETAEAILSYFKNSD